MAKRIVKRILVEEESTETVKVYKKVWEEVPDKVTTSKPKAPAKAKATPKAKAPAKKKEKE